MDHAAAIRTLAAERYALDEMTVDEREAFEAHFFECPECAQAVDAAVMVAEAARNADVYGPALAGPAPAAPARPPAPVWLSLAAAAVLALVAGYQTFVTIPGLRRALDTPHALAPTALAPTSRGDGIVVPRAQDGPVALALDINDAPETANLVYHLRTSTDDVILTGQAPVPPPGTPLLLLVPGTWRPPGQYVVVVREDASEPREVGTYRFTVR